MLSVIITVLNESQANLNRTVTSLLDTINLDRDEIIIIDDCSIIPVKIQQSHPIIKIERNKFRIGVAQSRHVGATLAKNKWLLLTDGHMHFHPDWYKNLLAHNIENSVDKIYCGTCVGIWEKYPETMDWLALPKYYGADLILQDKTKQQILEGQWTKKVPDGNECEISCLMGALYFIKKEFFFKIRGLSDLKMWGSDEPCLSIKTICTGGKIRLLKNVQAAHLFRPSAPYVTASKFMVYNKIRMAYTFFPTDLGRELIATLPRNNEFFEACFMFNQEHKIIEEYKKYYSSIFVKNIDHISGI